MDTITSILFLIIGLLLGGGLIWIIKRGSAESAFEQGKAVAGTELSVAQSEARHRAEGEQGVRQELAQLTRQMEELRQNYQTAKADLARTEAQLEGERKQNDEKLKLLDEAKKQFSHQFESLAGRIMEEKSKRFTEQNKENIGQILSPLREQLTEFRRKVADVYEKESRDRMSLFHEIKGLKELNQQISEDAINLTNALKGQNTTQGAWGEVILERVLEESGLHKGREYDTQESFTNEDGKRYRPDVIVHLPEGKDIVVDSKVSLTDYERYCSAEDEDTRRTALKAHIQSLKSHIKGLSGKNYEDLPGVKSLDLVLLFVPIEAAFITAVEHDRDLFREAFECNIIVVSPTTLLATLKTVHNIWRYEYQNRNAQEIAAKAGGLYDQFVLFVDSLDDVGDKLDKARQAYDKTRSRLTDGRGNLVRRTEQIKSLGAKAKKSLPESLVALAAEEDGATDIIDAPNSEETPKSQ